MAAEPNISVETLRQLLHYNPDTGVLSWRIRPVSLCKDERAWKIWNARYAGREALTANSNGATGVTLFSRNQKWRAQITVNGRNKALGYFTDFDEAVKARRLAEVRFGFHPNHGRKV